MATSAAGPPGNGIVLGVSDFVAVFNQTLEYAYPEVVINGELANLRVSKGRWLYFDLKDELSTVKFFGTAGQLPGPLEDGMILEVRGRPRLHHQYGFSVNVVSLRPAGEGSIKRAARLLQAKLTAEGLFDEARKRPLPYPPGRIGLVTSGQSAAYADFLKILAARWHGLAISHIDVQVQGEAAPAQIIAALKQLNGLAEPPEVIVLVRGGGSTDDLAAFNTEAVVRAVAASRVPTLVAVGHETDMSLAELAADRRASTPSNAAELLVPDRRHVLQELQAVRARLAQYVSVRLNSAQRQLEDRGVLLDRQTATILQAAAHRLHAHRQLLQALNPEAVLRRGYAIVRRDGRPLRSVRRLPNGAIVDVQLIDGRFRAAVTASRAEKPNAQS